MSVPLPSPSLLPSAAKPIPRSRPQPISTPSDQPGQSLGRSPSRPFADSVGSPSSPRAGSLRKSTARSAGLGAGDADNWRERSLGGSKSAVRTVGGFEKKSVAGTASSPRDTKPKPVTEQEKEGDKASLSHVPCRFFKAGACTAGDACPFSHEEGGKREVCQWFLKGNCKFGHKCALAHVRPGEPMSMDRKNKKAAQGDVKEKDGKETAGSSLIREGRSSFKPEGHLGPSASSDSVSNPVPIRSALSSSLQSPPVHRVVGSSPLREPFGPPSSGPMGGTSPGFARSPNPLSAFASSPSRPSPLSASFSARNSVPGPLSLKAAAHSPLRPPTSAFSSSFSHSSLRAGTSPAAPPLSASFADGARKNIWARNEAPNDQPEILSPRRPINNLPRQSQEDVFEGDLDAEDDYGEDLLPSSLSDLLTPRERARRLSRRDSNESFSASPGRAAFLWAGGERLAQSAGATMGPGFLKGLWSAEGADARKAGPVAPTGDYAYASGATGQDSTHPTLSAQRSPISPHLGTAGTDPNAPPFSIRALGDPHSPGTRAYQEHAPGQSLPGGLASALSRLHLHGPRTSSGLAHTTTEAADEEDDASAGDKKRDDHAEEGLFAMDG